MWYNERRKIYMITKFKEIKENPDYILARVDGDEGLFNLVLKKVDDDVVAFIHDIFYKMSKVVPEDEIYFSKIAIRKESYLGEYLMTHEDGKTIQNTSLYIDYDKIVNAFSIATYGKNEQMAMQLYPLIIKKVNGHYDDLKEHYSEDVLNYILEHDSFQEYLRKLDSKEDRQYLVYEEGYCYLDNVVTSKTLKKSIH